MGTVTAYVKRLVRLANSLDGNPRWQVTLSVGPDATDKVVLVARTKPDAGFVYSMGPSWEGKAVSLINPKAVAL